MFTRILCFVVWLWLNPHSTACAASGDSEPGSLPAMAAVPRPVWFEENSGQASREVAFIGRGFAVPLAILKSGALALGPQGGVVRLEPERPSVLAAVHGEAPTGAVTRSYAPGATNVSRHFSRVRVSSLWPGADLFYRITDGRLELGLDLMAGQTSNVPSLCWRGAKVSLDAVGRVHIRARGFRFMMRTPTAVQPADPAVRAVLHEPLAVRYLLSRAGRMSFGVSGADPALPLNIDPVFEFSTYIGGPQADSISGMALGPDGSIYLAGQSASTNLFGVDTGVPAGSGKVLITRLAPGGTGIVYAALIGGSGSDQGTAIAVDSNGSAYVTGNSNSSNFPVTSGAFRSGAAQDWNAFALKLDARGVLVYSSVLGGSGPDWGAAIAVDSTGRAVITGQTNSADFPVTERAFQRLIAGSQDCFVSMLSGDGASLVFSTFMGGSDLDSCRAVALSPSGIIALGGSTRSSDFPVLGAFQARTAGFLDGFVVQLDSTGSTLISSSYLGGIGEDQISSLALDGGGSVYVAGTTSTQANFPGSLAGVITKNGAGRNGFACKLAPVIVSVTWCSIVGGSGDDYVNALALLPSGEVVVAGQTTSVNLPVVNAVQSIFQGALDGWFAVLSSTGGQWETVSYSGGSAGNSVNAVVAFQDRVLLAGSTTAQNLQVTAGALQSASGGGGDGFLQQIAIGGGIALNGIYPPSGSGLTHGLSLVITDPSGAQSIQTVQVNVSNPNSVSSACVVTFVLPSNTLSLLNDAGSGSAGSAIAGSSTILQNSQCTVTASTSTLSISGTSLTLHLSLTYDSSFATVGAGVTKYVNILVTDSQGKTLSVPQAAVWVLVAQSPPTVVSVTPSSGLGASQAFALSVADPAGASDLATIQLLFGSSTALANACFITYIAKQNQFALASDSGTTSAGMLAPGQAATVSNSQCTINGFGSTIQLSGNTAVLTVSLQFSPAFSSLGDGAIKRIYAKPVNAAGQGPITGYVQAGTWTVPQSTVTGPLALVALSPASGQGMSQPFTLQVMDTAGAADLATVYLLISGPTSYTNACWIIYSSQKQTLGLVNDAASAYLGFVAPGQAASFSNSQCTLSGSGTSIQLNGNLLTLTASIQFNPAFAKLGSGAFKTVYGYPITAGGKALPALVPMGTWTIAESLASPPSVVSITPSSGQGTTQAFALTVLDPLGVGDLATVQLLFGTTTASSNACLVTYIAQQGTLGLTNDAGTGYSGFVTPGLPATVSNSQCTLSGNESSIRTAGNSLTITARLQFTNSFASSGGNPVKTVYAFPVNVSGQAPPGGLASVGTWSVSQIAVPPPPSVVSLSPSSGQGAAQRFVVIVADPAGAADLASVQLHFGSSTVLAGACSVTLAVQQNSISLLNDAGTGSAGAVTPGQATSASNSQCMLLGAGSSVAALGTSLTMTVDVQFDPGFAIPGNAMKNVYVEPLNLAGQGPAGGLVSVGTWTVTGSVGGPPTVLSLSPSTGQGSSASFALAVASPGGASNLATVQLLIGSSTAQASGCSVTYIAQQNTFGLTNDAGTGYAAYVSPGQASVISNSQCTLDGIGSAVQLAGNTLTMTVNLQFSNAFAGAGSGPLKNLYAKPTDGAGQVPATGMAVMGTWTVPQLVVGGPPTPIALTPASGQGASQVFTLVVSDTAGATDLSAVHLIVSGPANLSNACWVTYTPSKNTLGLVTDSASAYVGYVSPGQAANISNSQCTLGGSGSSVQSSGSLLSLTVSLSFSQSFSKVGSGPNKTIYAFPVNLAGKSPSSLVVMGTWSLP